MCIRDRVVCSVLHCVLGCVQCIRIVCAVVRRVIFNKFCFHNATCMFTGLFIVALRIIIVLNFDKNILLSFCVCLCKTSFLMYM